VAGIAAVGVYVPRFVITAAEYRKAIGKFAAKGIEEKTVPGFDEDEITMAVAAGERAIDAAKSPAVDRLVFASSGTLAGGRIVAEALGLNPTEARDILGSPDAGETVLAGAIDVASKEGTSTLVVVSDAPRADPGAVEEHAGGAAAVALLVTGKATQAWTRVAKSALLPRIGNVGAASVFVSFLESIARSKVKGAAAVAKALDGRIPVSYEQYLGLRRYKPAPAGTEYSQGAYVSMPAYLGEAKARYRLVAEECAKCGRLHFPPRESCIACGTRAWKERPLKRTGTVYAYTIIGKGAAPSEFLEQQLATGDYATAVVELDDGLRITAMLADANPASVRIGMRVRMVFRRIYAQEGVVRYGFKFAPA
jgi:uncharacterized OB-fold protein